MKTTAFGLFDHTMIPKLRRILRQQGIRLIVTQKREWGDQVELRVEPFKKAALLREPERV